MVYGCQMWFAAVASVSPPAVAQIAVLNSWFHLSLLNVFLTWNPSPGLSSCSDPAFWAVVMSWGYITPRSSYRWCVKLHNCFQSPRTRWSIKCFWTLPMPNILGYSCWTAFSTPQVRSHILTPFPSFFGAVCKNSASKCQMMQWCHTQAPTYLSSLILGHADLSIGPGQPQLPTMNALSLASELPLCDFASPFWPQMPIVQMKPLPFE